MRIIRYIDDHDGTIRLAAVTDGEQAYPLRSPDFIALVKEAEAAGISPLEAVRRQIEGAKPLTGDWRGFSLLTPVDAPEVWAAGVTYERSREARNEESTGGATGGETFYDKVYRAERPEIFFKSTGARTARPGSPVCIRSDSDWQVPEPELGIVLDSRGRILGYTAGNDMSCRDIEGENPLYLPQAKIWRRSCSFGPAIRLAETVPNPYDLTIVCRIYRDGELAVNESANTGQLRRKLDELASWLTKDNVVYDGTVLLTGTCIVPPGRFTLKPGDRIEIEISGIGTLINPVAAADATITA
ncbi:MAG: fumarylacetoacetate hydrolase [Thermobacillus sp. ZCTH02-B1]|uniref:fumarylacetoacetate hydrolase family protein n=1 Tax=Thermobacillus sp. ZCTH02-B1 TaxID=1858795 RepID=UPI000B559E59|nr:fumarylacetoacetate hydrolase family protein [Thermobacillus sp. ZCTH02-B1]OUM95602.1 MAG: fumarylacetoacetate hydrolase [Thermobacillus sp. ZCTH02-B1]